ncbi:hypothetical protein DICPUDRAFT_40315 [Dictyostelium purpureum]|uniref:Histone deacetylase complex subunit SAP18 n=1 Tax=Dictyostelium purpureum TaxID=5786 RepID=F0ZY08_DICPU|nr:uncharacterized protein DICPUDRAFT_40315 [Dictyostelium purpureum]EGC31174.1 hypothetical protein DICPUDRAFT_40315 [Dictyostelium purpureum]|eukprot:XP_003292294.1 hypothetical protein DICPUDRAFT_40315 [Dictyostelium purpureum]
MKGFNTGHGTFYVNRETTCPFLLRVFVTKGGSFHNVNEFSGRSKVPENDEIQLYTWRNATLKEISNLIKESFEEARNKDSKFEFAFIFPDQKGIFQIKPIGTIYSNKKTDDDFLTLHELSFNHQYLDVILTIPSVSKTALSPTLSN